MLLMRPERGSFSRAFGSPLILDVEDERLAQYTRRTPA
jgi:hypothetical protein